MKEKEQKYIEECLVSYLLVIIVWRIESLATFNCL